MVFYIPSLEILSLEKDFWLNELVEILVAEVIEDPVDGHDDQEISGDIMITILYVHILEITRYVTWLGF